MPDFHPDYLVATSIYREIKPKYLVSFGNVTEDFIKILVDLINDIEDNTVTTNTVRSIPENMSLLSLKYYRKLIIIIFIVFQILFYILM